MTIKSKTIFINIESIGFMELYFSLLLIAITIFTFKRLFISTTIYEFQKGVLYRNGKFIKLLEPGKYRYYKLSTSIKLFDLRKTAVTIPGQEVLTKDNASIKISLTGFYEIIDPIKTEHNSKDCTNEIYSYAQILLRELIGSYEIEKLLENKSELADQLTEGIQEQANNIGLKISLLTFRDIMLPAGLKKAFYGMVETKKEAQVLLEKARGEDAVLRKLANASKMYENNPSLLNSRIIQTLSSSNNTVVFKTNENVKVAKEGNKD